jgi:hypothetical protein
MDKPFSAQEAMDEIKKQGCRPANAHELVLWKDAHGSELKDSEWCLAFGETWRDSYGYLRVPFVRRLSDGDWRLHLGFFGIDWDGGHCLLCFCDSSLDSSILLNSVAVNRVIEK